jgi:hypothetical protein
VTTGEESASETTSRVEVIGHAILRNGRARVPDGRGHATVLLVAATASEVDLLDSLIPALCRGSRVRTPPIRLRMAVCAGAVGRHRLRWLGEDLGAAIRALQAQVPRQDPLADLAVVVSDVVNRAVQLRTTRDDVPRPARTASRPGS